MRIHPRSGLRGRALLATSVLSVAAGLTLAPVASAAAPAAAFSVEPVTGASAKGWFVLAPAAGATARGSVRVVNSGNAVGTVRLDAVDATTGRTSGAVYRDRALTPSDVGRWTHLARTRLTLVPGATAVVPFTVTVPQHARAGQHLGGIVAEQVDARAKGAPRPRHGRFSVRVRRQTIIALQVDLPGARAAALLPASLRAGAQSDYPTVDLGVVSPGTKLLKGQGRVILRDADGKLEANVTFALDTFVPGSRIAYPVALRDRLAPGAYTGAVSLRSAGRRIRRRFSFSVADPSAAAQHFGSRAAARRLAGASASPVLEVGGGLVLVLGSFGGGLVVARRRFGRRGSLDLASDAGTFVPGAEMRGSRSSGKEIVAVAEHRWAARRDAEALLAA